MSQTGGTSTSLRLNGGKLIVARAAFVLLSLAAILLFCLGIPPYYNELIRNINVEILLALQSLGMTVTFYAGYQTALAILLLAGCITAGLIIFRFKSDDWVALLVAFTLVGMGANAFSPLYLSYRTIDSKTPALFMMAIILVCQVLFCYTIPDGKFTQGWMKYAAGFLFAWLMVSVFWESFPINLYNWEGNGFTIYLLVELAALLSGIYALIYRYFHSSNPIKREQLKWVVFSIAVAVVVGIGCSLFLVFFEKINTSAGMILIMNMTTQTISVLAQLGVPAALVFSILRYRLYDIELVINRSLIYGSLTVFLAVVFAGVLLGLQTLFERITGSNQPPAIAIVAASLMVFSLFRPTLQVSQNFVNRKFFGIEVDLNDVDRMHARIEKASHLPSHAVTSVGGYTDLELIARGGMGEIYKARHPTLNRAVAIKILSIYFKDDSAFNQRFAREAELMAHLRHPNIITIYDYGEQNGLPYIVMEYLTGTNSLRDYEGKGACLSRRKSAPAGGSCIRPRLRPRPGCDPPRHQAIQRHPRADDHIHKRPDPARHPDGFWHRPLRKREYHAHRHRGCIGHRRLHLSRAGPWHRRAGPAGRPVQLRRDDLPAADRPQALRAQQHMGNDPLPHRGAAARPAHPRGHAGDRSRGAP